eukprot:3877851-Prymnesium_polylepis.1
MSVWSSCGATHTAEPARAARRSRTRDSSQFHHYLLVHGRPAGAGGPCAQRSTQTCAHTRPSAVAGCTSCARSGEHARSQCARCLEHGRAAVCLLPRLLQRAGLLPRSGALGGAPLLLRLDDHDQLWVL